MEIVAVYPALFIGVMFEGEIALIAGALAVQKGLANIYLVGLTAFLSTLITDWSWFFAGRIAGNRIISRFRRFEKHSERVRRWTMKYPVLIVFIYRYLYGMRIMTLLVMGMSGFSVRSYLFLSIPGILIWSVIFTVTGYYVGELVNRFIKLYEGYLIYLIPGFILGALIVILFRRFAGRILEKNRVLQ